MRVPLCGNLKTSLEGNMNQVKHRISYCTWGHDLTLDNSYISPQGVRSCRECRRKSMQRLRSKKARQHG